MAREGRTSGRYTVLIIVIAAHALLVVFLLARRELFVARRNSSEAPLVFLTLPTPVPRTDAAAPPKAATPESPTAPRKPTPSAPADSLYSLDLRALPIAPDSLSLGLGIDWDHEAQQVADAQSVSLFKELKHLCEQAALRGEIPPGCRHYRPPDPWKPEPKRFGLAEGFLPYVRLGKRCVLGLGFFGCGVGKLPDADGHVLDDMRDPDRPRSSVPDPNDPP